jgi:hypothetical protein
MFRITALAVALLIPGAGSAQTFLSSNGLVVRPVDSTSFDVLGDGFSEAKAYWCAASDYVIRRVGGVAATRITVVVPPGSLPSGKRDARFTIAPNAAKGQPTTTSISVKNTGANIDAGLGNLFCFDLRRQEDGN